MFNMPDISKLAEAAKEVQNNQAKVDQKKIDILARIEQKLDQILSELKKK